MMQYFLVILLFFGILSIWIHHSSLLGADNTSLLLNNPTQLFQNQHFSVAKLSKEKIRQRDEVENLRRQWKLDKQKKHAGGAKHIMNETAKQEHHEQVIQGHEEQMQKNEAQAELLNAVKENEELLKEQQQQEDGGGHTLAGLDCSTHGGPSNAAEMVYWSDIPSDNAHVSPFYSPSRYMTFEPDPGGWNNVRMSMESVLAMSVAMGRTLVLPPKQGMYLLDKDEHEKDVSASH